MSDEASAKRLKAGPAPLAVGSDGSKDSSGAAVTIFSRQWTPHGPAGSFFPTTEEKELDKMDEIPEDGNASEEEMAPAKAPTIPTVAVVAIDEEETDKENLPPTSPTSLGSPSSSGGAPPSHLITQVEKNEKKSIWSFLCGCFSTSAADSAAAHRAAAASMLKAESEREKAEKDANEAKKAEEGDVDIAEEDDKPAEVVLVDYPKGFLPRPADTSKMTLVLDLDETLVHSSFRPVPNADFVLKIEIDGNFYEVYVLKRPGVDEFLKEVGKHFEVVIFTASLPQYANPLLDKLDPDGVITGRLFREHCVRQGPIYIKDLRKIGRPMKTSILVDNSPNSWVFQPENSIPIITWFEDPSDTELFDLVHVLNKLRTFDDVAKVLNADRPWKDIVNKINAKHDD